MANHQYKLPSFVQKRNRAFERVAIKGDRRLVEALKMISTSMIEESRDGRGYWQRFCQGVIAVRSRIIQKVNEENQEIQKWNEALKDGEEEKEKDYLEVPIAITWLRLFGDFVPGRGIQLEHPEKCFIRYLEAAESLSHEFAVETAAGFGRYDLLWPDEIAAFSTGGVRAMVEKFEEKRREKVEAPQTPEIEETEEGEE